MNTSRATFSSSEGEITKPTPPQNREFRKPGELVFAGLLFLLGAFGYYFALDMTSGELSSPSVFPKLSSTLIMIFSAINFMKALKKEKSVEKDTHVFQYLLPRDVTVMITLLIAYCIALPKLHFVFASYIFMASAMIYLHKGKKIILSLTISALALAALIGIFRYLFLVILP